MKCKNCGSILVKGQVICSNCDTINPKETDVNDYSNYQKISYNKTNQNDIDDQIYNNDFEKENLNNDEEINNKNNKNYIIAIFILIVVIIGLVFGSKYLVEYLKNDGDSSKENEFLTKYKTIYQDINVRLSLGQEAVCDNDCSNIYDYDNNIYDLIIYDKDTFYEIHFTNNNNMSLNMDECISLTDVTCENNKITGKIYK